jgi:hypothetical protein
MTGPAKVDSICRVTQTSATQSMWKWPFLKFRQRRDLNHLSESLMKLAIARESLDRTGPTREAQLVNAMQSLTLLLYDCLVVFYGFQLAENGRHQRVYIRLFAILAMDAIDRFADPLGESGAEFRDIAVSASMEKPLANAAHKLNGVRRNHSAFLEQIRNNLIAHRSKNAREELQALESLDVAHAMRAFQDVLSWLDGLQADLWRLLLASGKLPAHVAQQIVGRERRARVSHHDWSGDA